MNWIFNKRLDWICFMLIPLLAFSVKPMIGEQLPFLAALWLAGILLDHSHIYGSLFRIYGDKREFKRYFKFYLLLPLCCFLFVYALRRPATDPYFNSILTYAAIIHYVRQQFGWMKLSLRNTQASKLIKSFFVAAIYVFTCIPVLHAHLLSGNYWLRPNDLVLIPNFQILIPALHAVAVSVFAAFAAVCLFNRNGRLNSSFVVGLSTFVCWYVGIVLYESFFPIIFLHAAPYIALVYRYGIRHLTSEESPIGLRKLFTASLSFVLFYLILVSAGNIGQTGEWSNWSYIPLTVAFFHYITDGIVWRISRPENKTVIEVLNKAA